MITMKIDTINPYVVKIIITARKHDSINQISRRIKLSYGWTYRWCKELINLGIFKESKSNLILNEENEFYHHMLDYIKSNFSKDIGFHYSVLDLFGIIYCFTKTDAAFIWTKGGYNIARYKDYYPIFIKVKEDQLATFREYCKKLNLKINSKKGIFYSVEVLNQFKISRLDSIPVDSLNETIGFMKKNIYNFQPALEMIKEMYGEKLNIKYKEANYV